MLVPLLLQALHKYALLPAFSKVVFGFVHSEELIHELGDKDVITSLSLRSLCKTVLGDTGLSTASAVDRSQVLVNIVTNITGGTGHMDKINKFCNSVSSEENQLTSLKNVLGNQVSD